MEEYTEISVNQIGIKCKSKKEVYNLLTTEGILSSSSRWYSL